MVKNLQRVCLEFKIVDNLNNKCNKYKLREYYKDFLIINVTSCDRKHGEEVVQERVFKTFI